MPLLPQQNQLGLNVQVAIQPKQVNIRLRRGRHKAQVMHRRKKLFVKLSAAGCFSVVVAIPLSHKVIYICLSSLSCGRCGLNCTNHTPI
jgi:hypothetical protein